MSKVDLVTQHLRTGKNVCPFSRGRFPILSIADPGCGKALAKAVAEREPAIVVLADSFVDDHTRQESRLLDVLLQMVLAGVAPAQHERIKRQFHECVHHNTYHFAFNGPHDNYFVHAMGPAYEPNHPRFLPWPGILLNNKTQVSAVDRITTMEIQIQVIHRARLLYDGIAFYHHPPRVTENLKQHSRLMLWMLSLMIELARVKQNSPQLGALLLSATGYFMALGRAAEGADLNRLSLGVAEMTIAFNDLAEDHPEEEK